MGHVHSWGTFLCSVERAKAFCEPPFALHRLQPKRDRQNGDDAPLRKISADAHGFDSVLAILRFLDFFSVFKETEVFLLQKIESD